MASIALNLPESVSVLMDGYIKAGVFKTREELLLVAISEFVHRNRIELMDFFANEDIEWAKKQKKK
jgi:hypothetical protein